MSSDQYRGRGQGRGRGAPRGGSGQRSDGGQRQDQRAGGDGRPQQRGQWQHRGGGGGSQRGAYGGDQRDTRSGQGGSQGGYRDGGGGRGDSHRGGRGGGDGYRGRGGRGRAVARPDSPVRLDVRKIAEVVNIIDPNKEPKGTKGNKVELITNLYPAKEPDDLIVCHYDIDIKLLKRDGSGFVPQKEVKNVRNDRKLEHKQIIDKMAAEWSEVLPANSYAFDGNKNLFTAHELQIGSETVTRSVTITLDGFPEQKYEVSVKFARTLTISELNTTEEFEYARQAMDIVLREGPQKSMVGVGRNFFNIDAQNTRQMPDLNCAIGFGHHQSILKTEAGLAINLDRVTTIFRTRNVEEPLLNFIKRELKVDSLDNFGFDDRTIHSLTKQLKDLKVFTLLKKIGSMPSKLRYRIESLSKIRPNQHRFKNDEQNEVTLEEYFNQKYGITLRYRDIPLLKMRGGTPANPKYIPVELCTVYPNQSMPKPLITPEIQSEIVASTNQQTPLKRFEKIQNSLQTITSESQELMETFGIDISPHPIKLFGRELKEPQLIGNANRLKDSKIDLKKSMFINLSYRVRDVQQFFNHFFNDSNDGLIATASRMGFKVTIPDIYDHRSNLSSPEARIKVFLETVPKGTQLVFVCLPYESQLYEMVKHVSENLCGVLTQCIKEDKFMNVKRGYFNNFLLKTNAKLNGQNQALATGQIEYRPKVLTDKNDTMIIGADVTHPGYHNPLANERVISSIAAVVGSFDSDFTKFMATVSAQGMNVEYIGNFGAMFEDNIKKIGKPFPKNIIIFRDGVSESQLGLVQQKEIPQIEQVYQRNKLAKPKITAYVVQKRHHIRLFRTKPDIDRNGRENYNMKSGTVVDHTITNPDLKEFHLCSHAGRLGTSRHAKYVVIRNDHRFTADQLQMLAYSMCFTYCRCQSPISIPIPVKYADLAAYRAKQHTAALNNPSAPVHTNFESARRGETEDQLKKREASNIQKLNDKMKVAENIVKIPYYC